MEYVVAKVNFSGNDDVNFVGFTARKVHSMQDWIEQVDKMVNDKFEADGYVDIYHSDNSATPFSTAQELLSTISFKSITEDEFKALKRILGGTNEKIQYGNDLGDEYLDYQPPQNAKKMKP